MVSSKRYGSKVQLNHLKNGDISYYITFKDGGNSVFKKVGKKSEGITEAKAIELRNQILSQQRHGIDLSQRSFKYLTFDKLAEVYFESNEAHNKSNKKYKQMYERHIKNSFGDVVISKLNDSLIVELQALKKAEGLSNSSINIVIKLVRRIIGFGVKRAIIHSNPFRNIRFFKVDNTRLRYLKKDEIAKLYEDVKGDVVLTVFVSIALLTGARANSILSIQKKHINFENRTIMLKDFKRNNTYVGYLDATTFEKIEQYVQGFRLNDYVVSVNGKQTKYHKICKQLTQIFEQFNEGLDKKDRKNRVVIHTLRHTFASHLAIKGTPIQKIQKLMNHSNINMTLKYAKLMPDSGSSEIEDLYKEIM